LSSEGRGTAAYRAPELYDEEPQYNNKSDIWSFGCLVFELCTNHKAFLNDVVAKLYLERSEPQKTMFDEEVLKSITKSEVEKVAVMAQRCVESSLCGYEKRSSARGLLQMTV